ncbi:MAG: hypothetical protein WC645_00360 [Candidatus Margulisiibacteriota bacterium]
MAESKSPSFEEIMKQIEEFEKTVSELAKNVDNLKKKLLTNQEKYGSDISKWPQM